MFMIFSQNIERALQSLKSHCYTLPNMGVDDQCDTRFASA